MVQFLPYSVDCRGVAGEVMGVLEHSLPKIWSSFSLHVIMQLVAFVNNWCYILIELL